MSTEANRTVHLCVNSCICTTASSHTLSLRQQFAADRLISIATIARVGNDDIKKIDCQKKATVQQKEGDCNRGVTQGAALPGSTAAASRWGLRERPLPVIKHSVTRMERSADVTGKKEGNDRELLQRALLGFKHLVCCLSSLFILPSPSWISHPFFYAKAPLSPPLISPLPPFANTLTPPN